MSYKVRHKPTLLLLLRSSNSSPRYLSKRKKKNNNENLCLQKDFNVNVYKNFYIIYKNRDNPNVYQETNEKQINSAKRNEMLIFISMNKKH